MVSKGLLTSVMYELCMVTLKTKLRALKKLQAKLIDLDAHYLTSKLMGHKEYSERRKSLRLAFEKIKREY